MRRVADLVLASPAEAASLPVARLATATGSSVGTVVRFCQTIGYPGYQDFKDALAAAVAVPIGSGHREARVPEGTVDTVMLNTVVSMARSTESLDPQPIHSAAAMLLGASRILIPSAGPSQPLAMALAQMLQIAGHSVSHPVDLHTQLAVAQQLDDQAVCFLISHSGTTAQTLQAADAARASGARLIALTSYSTSPLARSADVTIVAGAPADAHRSSDRASRPLHLAVIQALFAVLEHGAD
jgi:RpiR family transcriptional regulator, carbohydrate utilization regulator